jgi:hypothetical protein
MDVLFFFINREKRLTIVSKNSPLSLLKSFCLEYSRKVG